MKCPYCDVEMGKLTIEGSRGMKIDNLEKWEKSKVDVKKLPNSEWFRESYRYECFECPDCFHREDITKEEPIVMVSDN